MPKLLPDSYESLRALNAEQGLIPVVKVIPADLLTPVSAYMKIRGQSPYAFLLESVEGGERLARYSFLGTRPRMVMRACGGRILVEKEDGVTNQPGPVLDFLRNELGSREVIRHADLPPFLGGAVGYLGYDAVSWFESVDLRSRDDLDIDTSVLMFSPNLLAFDHLKHQIHIIATIAGGGSEAGLRERYVQACAEIERIEQWLRHERPSTTGRRDDQPLSFQSNTTPEEFGQKVRSIKDAITRGDAYQVVLSQRLTAEIGDLDPLLIYRALRMINPSPYMFFLELNDLTLVGASPEMLVRCSGRQLSYRPIAGTRPRGETEEEDRRLEVELLGDEKERAEHVMLVDLGRNDLGRVSSYGSVRVDEFMKVERYSHVMHLVSAVSGTLAAGRDCFDALAACMPAGTVTGAPKVSAMNMIDQLEGLRRGTYAGAVLYADYSGNLDSCIAIRTLLIKDRVAYLQAGAGIVADSDPQREY
ncbi:MAG: anthranilate synthase component I family protein, partial [Acidobacteria bacterium]|nr:anthranilate synthase component I family protein [Acidobacteriota bacterium]